MRTRKRLIISNVISISLNEVAIEKSIEVGTNEIDHSDTVL